MEMHSEYLTSDDIARSIGVQKATVQKYVKKGWLNPSSKGEFGEFYFEKDQIESLKRICKERDDQAKRNFSPRSSSYFSSVDDQKIVESWRVRKCDTGSVDIEIGRLSERIKMLEEMLPIIAKKNPEDFLNQRLLLVEFTIKRRKSLEFLKSTDTSRYYKALERLGMCA